MGRNSQPTVQTFLRCPCGNIQTIRRRACSQRKAGHKKHLWCIKCLERTPHVELKYEWNLDKGKNNRVGIV